MMSSRINILMNSVSGEQNCKWTIATCATEVTLCQNGSVPPGANHRKKSSENKSGASAFVSKLAPPIPAITTI